MKKTGFDKSIVVLLISSVVTMCVVVGYEVYRAYFQVKIPEDVERLLTPLDTTLETSIFDKLTERQL
jgi:hypothetical protein